MGNEYYPDEDDSWFDEEMLDINEIAKQAYNNARNIKRDGKGRLSKGSRLAHKDTCDENRIKGFLRQGCSVKQIVEKLNCSKSTVYRVKKKYEEQQADTSIWER